MREAYAQAVRLPHAERSPLQRRAIGEYARVRYQHSPALKSWHATRKASGTALLAVIMNRAKRKNIPFDLDVAWYQAELEKAKAKWPLLKAGIKNDTFWAAEVDRIIPANGYVKSNCRVIPHGLNLAKSNWSRDEMVILVDLLKEEITQD